MTQQCKDLRQELGLWHRPEYKRARNITDDVGTQISHTNENLRLNPQAVLHANLARVQESLRVLEEYGKILDPAMAAAMQTMRYQVYGLESRLGGDRQRRLQKLAAARLYLVTMPVPNLVAIVESCLKAGLGLVQYRQKEGDDKDRFAIAQQLCDLCHRYDALFLVNDRIDVAIAVGADGVHLGQQDCPIAVARKLLGSDAILGQSTTCPAELEIALDNQVDYVGVGPVFATPTKPGKAAAGFGYVGYAAQNLTIPWYAIGGIDLDNLREVMDAGANRVAVVRSLITAIDPQKTTRNLLQNLQSNF